MSGESERILVFKNRIKELESILQEKTTLLDQHEVYNTAADQKIAALNSIHGEKIRSLMNSIQLLRKENASLKQLGKEHKRSQLIEQLNQEIKEQDTVIEALKSLINDDAKCDAAIVKALNQGPPKIKSLSREELKIENKKLQAQMLTMKKKGVSDSQLSSASTQQSIKSTKATTEAPLQLNNNEALMRDMEELRKQNEELQLSLKANDEIHLKFEEELKKRGDEISELRSAKTDYTILNKKYEALQRQLEDHRSALIGKEVLKLNNELQIEEMQIINRVQGGKLQHAEKNLRSEVETLQLKIDQANRDREEIQQEYAKVLVRYDDLNKRFNDLSVRLLTTREENNKMKKELETKTGYYEKQIKDLLKAQALLEEDLAKKRELLAEANLRCEALAKDNQELTDGLREMEVQLDSMKSPDENETELNRHIHDILRKHEKGTGELDKAMKIQKEHYENAIKDLQKRLIVAHEKNVKNLDNISSDVSRLIQQSDKSQQGFDDLNSDFSGSASQKEKFYGGHYGLIQNERIRRMSSNIDGMLDSEEQQAQPEEYQDFNSDVSLTGTILENEQKLMLAPMQKSRKEQYSQIQHISQMDSSLGSMVSQSQQERNLNEVSSNISEFSLKSKRSSVISSNVGSNSQQSKIGNSNPRTRQASAAKKK